jgi:hypothetical protein
MRESKHQLLSLVLLLCLTAGVTFLTKAYATDSSDIDTLLAASSQMVSGDRSITLIHRQSLGEFLNEEQMQELGASWSQALQLPVSYVRLSSGNPIYETKEASIPGSSSSLRITVLPDHTLYMILRVQAFGSQEQAHESIAKLRDQYEDALAEFSMVPSWNTIIQGSLGHTSDSSITFTDLQNHVSSALQAKLIEQYMDGRTASWTFYSDELTASLQSGSRQVNLQVNVHQDTSKSVPTITIGSPLITTDTQLP